MDGQSTCERGGRAAFRTLVAMLALLAAPLAGQTEPFSVTSDFYPGLRLLTFSVPDGRVRVYLPSEIGGGERISGTAEVVEARSSAVRAYAIEFAGEQSRIGGAFQRTVPTRSQRGYEPLLLIDVRDRVIASALVPVATPESLAWEPPMAAVDEFVEAGALLAIAGPFDGDSGNTSFTIQRERVAILAESPRNAVFRVPADLPESAGYELRDGARSGAGTLRRIRVQLRLAKASLRNGENAEMELQVEGLRDLTRPIALRIENRTPSLAAVRSRNEYPSGWPWRSTLPYLWIRGEQLDRRGVYVEKFDLRGIQPGPLRIEATVVSPLSRLEEVALALRELRPDLTGPPEAAHAARLRSFGYDAAPQLVRLLSDSGLAYEAAGTLLRYDRERGLQAILAAKPADRNVQRIAFGEFLRASTEERRRLTGPAHDAAAGALDAGTSADAAVEALKVLAEAGSERDFALLERYANASNTDDVWPSLVRGAAEGAMARLGSAEYLARIIRDLGEARSDSFQAAMHLGRVLETAAIARRAELTPYVCPHLWSAVRVDGGDLIADPSLSAAIALDAIEGGDAGAPRTPGDTQTWKQYCEARGFGPR